MAELVEALVTLIAASVRLCIQLIAVVLELLGFAAEYLTNNPKAGDRRFSRKQLWGAFAPFAITMTVIISTILYFHWKANTRREREHETRLLTDQTADQLAGNVGDDGHLNRLARGKLDVVDSWGNPLRVAYDETFLHESIEVRSDGADEKANTLDDLSSRRQILRPKKQIAQNAIDKVRRATRNRLQNHD